IATVNGPGTLTNATGKTMTLTGCTINAPLVNQGILNVQQTSNVNGTFTTVSGSRIHIEGTGGLGSAQLTAADGFTNNGTIELTSSVSSWNSTLNVTSGTLVNAAGDSINVLAGAGGARSLGAQLDNQGILAVSQPLGLSKPSAAHQNSGTIDLSNSDMT